MANEVNNNMDSLAEQFRLGNSTAFKEIYKLLYPRLFYFAIKLIKDREEAEDIVIQAFAKLFQRHKDFESFPSLRAFLYRCVRNACFNNLKFKQRNLACLAELESTLAQDDNFENQLVEAEVLEIIYKAIERLPTECKKVFKMIYYEGMEHAVIAERLKISVFTVRNQRKRAIVLLRNMLSQNHSLLLAFILSAGLLQYYNNAVIN